MLMLLYGKLRNLLLTPFRSGNNNTSQRRKRHHHHHKRTMNSDDDLVLMVPFKRTSMNKCLYRGILILVLIMIIINTYLHNALLFNAIYHFSTISSSSSSFYYDEPDYVVDDFNDNISNVRLYNRSIPPTRRQQKQYMMNNDTTTNNNISCRYDGHCPTGFTCAVGSSNNDIIRNNNNSMMIGFCEPIISHHYYNQQLKRSTQTRTKDDMNNSSSILMKECFNKCLNELIVDEHYYYESTPIVLWKESIPSHGRPNGCLIGYQRKLGYNNQQLISKLQKLDQQKIHMETYDQTASIEQWINNRFQYIIRVDPFIDDDHDEYQDSSNNYGHDDNLWMAFCYNPCETSHDCKTANDNNNDDINKPPGFVCQSGVCIRNPLYWDDDNNNDSNNNRNNFNESVTSTATINDNNDINNYHQYHNKLVIVTAASEEFHGSLHNLAASIKYWAPNHSLVVYNLGGALSDNIKQEILSWSNVISLEWSNGTPDHYPYHVRKLPRVYAWKPIIMNETIHQYRYKYNGILWLDAGSTLAGPIEPVEEITKRTGLFLVKGQDTNFLPYSHVGTFNWLGYSKKNFIGGPSYSGNTQAYLYPSRYIDSIVIPNAACAMDPDCIMPKGSDLRNHRYDQTSLSILCYNSKVQAPHYTEYLAASRRNVNRDLKQPSIRFIWTSRGRCGFYSKQVRLKI